MVIGVPLGLLSGYVGGRLDRTLVLRPGRGLRLPRAAAVDHRRVHAEGEARRRPAVGGGGGRRRLRPAVLPGDPQPHDVGEAGAVRRGRPLARCQAPDGGRPLRLLQRGAERAGDLHAQRGRRGADPRRPRLPGLRRHVPEGGVGPRRESRAISDAVSNLWWTALSARARDHAAGDRAHAARRGPERHHQPAAALPWPHRPGRAAQRRGRPRPVAGAIADLGAAEEP